MLRNSDSAWGGVAKAFHWAMAGLIGTQIVLGVMAANWRMSPAKLELFVWHKSIGVLVLVLVVLRLLWRLANRTPVLPADMPAWERSAAHGSHALLYALMIALPLTGWVVNSAAGIPFRVFWLVPLPAITATDEAVAELFARVHDGLALMLAIVLAVHVAAALRHHFVKRNEVLLRMLPGRSA